MSLKKTLSYNLQCIPGARVKKKLIVIESDDWGSVRMRSKAAYDALLKSNIPVDQSYYNKYDSMANETDLSLLFETLTSHKGADGRHPVITANTIVANPDFDKIKDSNFENYYLESFTTTLKKYGSNHENVFALWKQGIEGQIFIPQLHGREHLNYKRWMLALQSNDKRARRAFDYGVFGYPVPPKSAFFHNFMAAFDLDSDADREQQRKVIIEGAELFEEIFGFKSDSFIAPNYVWHKGIEEALSHFGVGQIQSGLYQFDPSIKLGQYKKVMHWLGQQNEFNQFYSIRNCFFEPSFDKRTDWINDCLKRIGIAFTWNKPAIICSHRINYIGNIDPANRENGLRQLNELLKKITKAWPEAIFISSNELKSQLINER